MIVFLGILCETKGVLLVKSAVYPGLDRNSQDRFEGRWCAWNRSLRLTDHLLLQNAVEHPARCSCLFVISTFGRWLFDEQDYHVFFWLEFQMPQMAQKKTPRYTRSFPTKTSFGHCGTGRWSTSRGPSRWIQHSILLYAAWWVGPQLLNPADLPDSSLITTRCTRTVSHLIRDVLVDLKNQATIDKKSSTIFCLFALPTRYVAYFFSLSL